MTNCSCLTSLAAKTRILSQRFLAGTSRPRDSDPQPSVYKTLALPLRQGGIFKSLMPYLNITLNPCYYILNFLKINLTKSVLNKIYLCHTGSKSNVSPVKIISIIYYILHKHFPLFYLFFIFYIYYTKNFLKNQIRVNLQYKHRDIEDQTVYKHLDHQDIYLILKVFHNSPH